MSGNQKEGPFKHFGMTAGLFIILFALLGKPVANLFGFGYGEEVKRATDALVPMHVEAFEAALVEGGKIPTIVFFYASWCGYCKEEFRHLRHLRERYPEEELRLLYISLDRNAYELGEFMLHVPLIERFTRYHASTSEQQRLAHHLAKNYNIYLNGGVPHLAFLDKNGKTVHEGQGIYDMYQLQQVLRPLL